MLFNQWKNSYANIDDEDIKDFILRDGKFFRGNSFQFWYICSWKLDKKRKGSFKVKDVEHRLYVNLDRTEVYKFVKYFVEKCEEKNVPFYFKFTHGIKRDESVVVCSNTNNLLKYIEVLEEIKKEHPELLFRLENRQFVVVE